MRIRSPPEGREANTSVRLHLEWVRADPTTQGHGVRLTIDGAERGPIRPAGGTRSDQKEPRSMGRPGSVPPHLRRIGSKPQPLPERETLRVRSQDVDDHGRPSGEPRPDEVPERQGAKAAISVPALDEELP